MPPAFTALIWLLSFRFAPSWKESTLRGSKAYRVSAERDDFATALEYLATCRDAYSPIITRTPLASRRHLRPQGGTGEIVYEAPGIDEVPALIDELVASLNAPCDDHIVQAGMAHLNLVMIRPFRDGNGRMARCVQSLVLARGKILAPVFMSIILTAHLRQARTMLVRIRETERLWIDLERLAGQQGLPERVLPLLHDAAMGLRVRNATYHAILEQSGEEPITEQTASRDFQRLVAAGLLVPGGEKRGRSYVGGPDLRVLRRAIVEVRDPRDNSDPFAD